MQNISCSFTGHRPSRFSFGYDERAEACIRLRARMTQEIERLIQRGVTCFYTGMAQGADQWAASIVIEIKRARADIWLGAILPCATQADRWPSAQREKYRGILRQCNEFTVLHPRYTSWCMQERSRLLVERSAHLLAVYDGSGTGGTAYTVKYAQRLGREVTIISLDF